MASAVLARGAKVEAAIIIASSMSIALAMIRLRKALLTANQLGNERYATLPAWFEIKEAAN